jgi:hypothetical protein
MAKRSKVRISDYDLCRVGTLAHNRDFSRRELSEYLRRDASPMFKRMVKEGMLERVGRGRYFPTEQGWRNIENACEGTLRATSTLRGARRKRRR